MWKKLTSFNWSCPRCLQTTENFANFSHNETTLTAVTATSSYNTTFTESRKDPFLVLNQSVGDKNLKIGHLNINGLVNKLCEVQHLLLAVKFDLLGITQTHLNSSVSDDWITIPGYNLVWRDRDSCGGGVLIYFKQDLTVYPVPSWVEIQPGSNMAKHHHEISILPSWLCLQTTKRLLLFRSF